MFHFSITFFDHFSNTHLLSCWSHCETWSLSVTRTLLISFPTSVLVFHILLIFAVWQVKTTHKCLTNQIAGILHFNHKSNSTLNNYQLRPSLCTILRKLSFSCWFWAPWFLKMVLNYLKTAPLLCPFGFSCF